MLTELVIALALSQTPAPPQKIALVFGPHPADVVIVEIPFNRQDLVGVGGPIPAHITPERFRAALDIALGTRPSYPRPGFQGTPSDVERERWQRQPLNCAKGFQRGVVCQ